MRRIRKQPENNEQNGNNSIPINLNVNELNFSIKRQNG